MVFKKKNTQKRFFTAVYVHIPGADPGFPIGGGHQPSLERMPTSDTGTFQ